MKFLDNGNSIEILSGMDLKLPKPYGIKSVIAFEDIVVFEGGENSFWAYDCRSREILWSYNENEIGLLIARENVKPYLSWITAYSSDNSGELIKYQTGFKSESYWTSNEKYVKSENVFFVKKSGELVEGELSAAGYSKRKMENDYMSYSFFISAVSLSEKYDKRAHRLLVEISDGGKSKYKSLYDLNALTGGLALLAVGEIDQSI